MNPLFAEARETVMGGWLMGVMTGAFLFFFIGWTLWAYWPARREIMRRASMMPFDDVDIAPDTGAEGADR